jgi:hypothetical protein
MLFFVQKHFWLGFGTFLNFCCIPDTITVSRLSFRLERVVLDVPRCTIHSG